MRRTSLASLVTTDRRFCRFSKSAETARFGMPEVPRDGLCLSAFVILTADETPTAVLMGHLNPEAPWDHLGALDPARVEAHRGGWMLPSSHLILLEAPEAAAQRVLREQLRLGPRVLEGPRVVSEVYTPRRHAGHPEHWDLEFLFRGHLPLSEAPTSEAWTELRFVDTRNVHRAEIARTHEDVLASAGLPIAD
jgi:ADP-ribose pyrophosphatase YjhB (NUDIX family)